jgi:hypothetical protein
LLSKECDELKSKLESNETKTSNSFEHYETSIPCAIPISKVDASTSCIDLIDESCSPSCPENVVVETCDYLIGKENDELKQEVKWLQDRLANLMGKGNVGGYPKNSDNYPNTSMSSQHARAQS